MEGDLLVGQRDVPARVFSSTFLVYKVPEKWAGGGGGGAGVEFRSVRTHALPPAWW